MLRLAQTLSSLAFSSSGFYPRVFSHLAFCLAALSISPMGPPTTSAEEDILIADFEGETYGDWKTQGQAFGSGPAPGTLRGQMHVSGYRGKRLANSFLGGDQPTGTLTSPPLKIQRKFLTFLIGGGGFPGKTCINLLFDGQVVRTAEGPNTRAGGSEQLGPHFWDVQELQGKTVSIQIVDAASGGWGHINIDHIVQSDQKPKLPELRNRTKEFVVGSKYLVIPIKNGAKATELTLLVESRPVRRYKTELATSEEDTDWYAFFTIEAYRGQSAQVTAAAATEEGFALIRPADEVPGSSGWYNEPLRPQFHFSQAVGWNNDPNGMVYLDGQWHLFFQHNPVGWRWGNMTWGHAVSRDLIHWEQLPNALFPSTMARGACFSGGATVDHQNTAGWKTGNQDVLVAFLTDTGAGEAVAYSNDNGRSFTWHEGNPVVKHRGRDPKVIWYRYEDDDTPISQAAQQLGGHWVMAVYDEHPQHKRNIAFYTSTNLKEWTEQSHLAGYYECPELFELPVDGDKGNRRWVVFAADARYTIGTFDGKRFTPEHPKKHRVHYGPYYASQIFDNAPGGRKIQIGWVRLAMPGMPFNQTFSFPHELTLRKTDQGIRMFAKPVQEIEKLHRKRHLAQSQPLNDSPVRLGVSGELLDIRATVQFGRAKQVGLKFGNDQIVYNVDAQKLQGAAMTPQDGKISLQVLVDRPMMEICGNDGAVFITAGRNRKGTGQQDPIREIEVFADGAGAQLLSLEVYELESIWKTKD